MPSGPAYPPPTGGGYPSQIPPPDGSAYPPQNYYNPQAQPTTALPPPYTPTDTKT